MRVIALDLSKSSTGWACWGEGDARPASSTWELGTSYTSVEEACAKLHDNLDGLQMLGSIDALYYEQPIIPRPRKDDEGRDVVTTTFATVFLQFSLAQHASYWAWSNRCPYRRSVPQGTWRAHFLGGIPRGKAMQEALAQRRVKNATALYKLLSEERCREYGFRPRKHDEAEALGILDYACHDLQLTPPWRDAALFGGAMAGAA